MIETAERLLQQAQEARREGRHSSAQHALDEAIILLRRVGSPSELALALRTLGEVHRSLRDPRAACRCYEEAVPILRGLEEPLRLAHALRHLGDVHHESGHPAQAEPCYIEALALYRVHPEAPPLDLANALRSLAVLKGQAVENEVARSLWEEARGLYAACGVAAGVAESTERLAQLD